MVHELGSRKVGGKLVEKDEGGYETSFTINVPWGCWSDAATAAIVSAPKGREPCSHWRLHCGEVETSDDLIRKRQVTGFE